ncbi:hypothetical protein KFK09_018191 [Dendrobium nobile]|uniref:DUF4283 domain-containing protein n=1 Tax=Dendrobium nobile TaxID=94219 RepID=A0A8T3AU67_DENNO|nr:hypothetical protein KFK09_018191 [Dendrobium nobile]
MVSFTGWLFHREATFYDVLLSVIKKTWTLKGSLSLLTMDDDFFLLKFSALEDYEQDYELAWSGGPWFFFDKSFILRKWTPEFVPKCEEFPSIPLWIKIMNLLLSLSGLQKVYLNFLAVLVFLLLLMP